MAGEEPGRAVALHKEEGSADRGRREVPVQSIADANP
jgi:hypothetical protein